MNHEPVKTNLPFFAGLCLLGLLAIILSALAARPARAGVRAAPGGLAPKRPARTAARCANQSQVAARARRSALVEYDVTGPRQRPA